MVAAPTSTPYKSAADAVMGTGIGLVQQEDRAEQHRAGQQLIPHTLQTGEQTGRKGSVQQAHLPGGTETR